MRHSDSEYYYNEGEVEASSSNSAESDLSDNVEDENVLSELLKRMQINSAPLAEGQEGQDYSDEEYSSEYEENSEAECSDKEYFTGEEELSETEFISLERAQILLMNENKRLEWQIQQLVDNNQGLISENEKLRKALAVNNFRGVAISDYLREIKTYSEVVSKLKHELASLEEKSRELEVRNRCLETDYRFLHTSYMAAIKELRVRELFGTPLQAQQGSQQSFQKRIAKSRLENILPNSQSGVTDEGEEKGTKRPSKRQRPGAWELQITKEGNGENTMGRPPSRSI